MDNRPRRRTVSYQDDYQNSEQNYEQQSHQAPGYRPSASPQRALSYEYKTVPGPKALVAKNEKEYDNAVRGYAKLINNEAYDGWEFYSMETVTVQEASGCLKFLGIFNGKTANSMSYNMLVFRRRIS